MPPIGVVGLDRIDRSVEALRLAHFGRLTIAVHLRIRAPFGAYSETRRNQDASRPAQRDGRTLSPRHAIAEEWQILRGWRCPAESAYRLDDI